MAGLSYRRWEARLDDSPLAPWMLALVAIFFTAAYLVLPPASPLLTADSPSYLYFGLGRPIGYPVFLRIVRLATGGYAAVRPLQVILFTFSTLLASLALRRFGWGLIAAGLFELGVLGYPGPIRLSDMIMSDSLAASLYLLYLAAVLHFIDKPTLRRYGLPCAVMAVLITVRPVGIALFASNLILLCLARTKTEKPLAAFFVLLALFAFGWYATPVADRMMHGDKAADTPLARGLLQKVIFREPNRLSPDAGCDAEFIESATLPVLHYLEAAPPEIAKLMRPRYSGYLRFQTIIPGLVKRHHLAALPEADPILMCYSVARLKSDPAFIFEVTAYDYWNLITNYTFITEQQKERYEAFMASHPPVLPASYEKPEIEYRLRRMAIEETGQSSTKADYFENKEVTFEPPHIRPTIFILILEFLQVAATLASVFIMARVFFSVIGLGRPAGAEWLAMGIIALAGQLSLIITAFVEIALPRYFFPVWAYYWLILVFVLKAILQNIPRKTMGETA